MLHFHVSQTASASLKPLKHRLCKNLDDRTFVKCNLCVLDAITLIR